MKALILLALVATINCSWLSWTGVSSNSGQGGQQSDRYQTKNTKYQSGKEYIYKYESQVLTGLPTFTKSYGGVKVVCKVKLAFTSTTQVDMQLEDVKVLTLNQEVDDPKYLLPKKQLTEDLFSPLPSGNSRPVIEKLQLPIKFTYSEGQVTGIQISDKESNWSVDLKRSIISMLQIRLQAKEEQLVAKLEYNNLEKENSTSFVHLEPALDGTCYSNIRVVPAELLTIDYQSQQDIQQQGQQGQQQGQQQEGPQGQLFKVYKSRNPEDCLTVNTIYKMTHSQHIVDCKCKENFNDKECECKPLTEEFRKANPEFTNARTVSEYDLVSEDKKTFLIKKCVQSATYRYEFPHTPDQFLATLSNQTLTLVEEREQPTVNTRTTSFKSVSEPWAQQLLKPEEEKLMMESQQLIATVKNLVEEMVTISKEHERFDDHLTVFYQLIEMVRLCKEQELTQLHSTLVRESKVGTEEYKKWKVFVDAVVHANTTVCDKFVVDKITSKEIPDMEAVSILLIWSADKVPTFQLLDLVKDRLIPAFERNQEKKYIYHHALMCYGAMVRRIVHHEQIKKSLCALEKDIKMHEANIALCRQYEKVIESKLSSARTDEEKIALLKATANLGNIKGLPLIQKLLAKTETTTVRLHAVYALKNLCYQNRMQVLQTLLPILNNPLEDSELRMASFIFYMRCNPSTAHLHKLINNEHDVELKTFIVKYLKNLIQVEKTTEKERNMKIKEVLKQVRAFHMSPVTESFLAKFTMTPEGDGDIFSWRWLTNQTSPQVPRAFAFKHMATIRDRNHHLLEIGYRAEGLEQLLSKVAEKSSFLTPHTDLSVLDNIRNMIGRNKDVKQKPSLTLYIRANNMHVSFLHLDEQTIGTLMQKAMQQGKLSIPIRIFQTYVMKPEQVKTLQPHGMWLVNEKIHYGVFDVEGHLNLTMKQGEMPQFVFGSHKAARIEKKSIISQYVRCGFAKVGITSAMLGREHIKEQQWNITLAMQNKNLTVQFKNPSDVLLTTELHAYTNTFVLPMRLPQPVTEKRIAFKDIRTEDNDRRRFNYELDVMKSVELRTQIEGDVYMPQLYTFVRDRLHLLPTCLSFHKQQVKVTVRPATSSQRLYELNLFARQMGSQEQMDQQTDDMQEDDKSWWQTDSSSSNSESDEEREKQKDEKKSWWENMWGGVFEKDQDSSSEHSSEEQKDKDLMRPLSLGSIRYIYSARISAISRSRNLSMIANVTTQYDHEKPELQAIWKIERPPVSGMERDKVLIKIQTDIVMNPASNEWVGTHHITWGERSSSNKKQITITGKRTPVYKGNQCYEQTIYGCKDQFGVIYPVWYNKTFGINFKNTNLPNTTLSMLQTYFQNQAKSVFSSIIPDYAMQAVQKIMPMVQNSLNISFLVRPLDSEVDVVYSFGGMKVNLTTIYAPIETKLDELMFGTHDYDLSTEQSISSQLPRHHLSWPFSSRDACLLESSRLTTFDKKEIQIPKSDCEVILLGDCGNSQKGLMVTVKPAATDDKQAEKVLKVILGQHKVEISFTPGSIFSNTDIKVKVDGESKSVDQQKEIKIGGQQNQQQGGQQNQQWGGQQNQQQGGQQGQQGQEVGTLRCQNNRCELQSDVYGVYLDLNTDRVKVESTNGKSQQLCGLCATRQDLPKTVTGKQAVELVKENKASRESCNIDETTNQQQGSQQGYQQDKCTKTYKHKFMNALVDGKIRSCVSVNSLPMCSKSCRDPKVRVDDVSLRCMDRDTAERDGIIPQYQGDEMFIENDRILTRMRGSVQHQTTIRVAQECY